jgi:hypothetical protein
MCKFDFLRFRSACSNVSGQFTGAMFSILNRTARLAYHTTPLLLLRCLYIGAGLPYALMQSLQRKPKRRNDSHIQD